MMDYGPDGHVDGHDMLTDMVVRRVSEAVAAERERCASVLRYWLTGHTPAAWAYEAQCLEHVLDGRPAPTGWTESA